VHDNELNEILQVVDQPTEAPSGFKTDLLDDLNAALTAPASRTRTRPDQQHAPMPGASTEEPDQSIALDEIRPGEDDQRTLRTRAARWAYTTLTAAAAVILVVVMVTFRDDEVNQPVEVTDQPTPAATPSLREMPQVPPDVACNDFVEATTGLDELTELVTTDVPAVQAELQTWLTEFDRLRARTADSIGQELDRPLTETRILIRQALQVTEQPLVVDLDQKWHDLTSSDGSLAACRE
jgi:hypothetical protein